MLAINVFTLMIAAGEGSTTPQATQLREDANRLFDMSSLQNLSMNDIWNFIVSNDWLTAVFFLGAGIILLAYGWRMFRLVVMLNCAVLGGWLGGVLGERMGVPALMAATLALAFGAASIPFMKYAIALMGGVAGALLGAAFWKAVQLAPGLTWAGALIGLIACGLAAFAVTRTAIMVFTSLQGSALLVIGMLGVAAKVASIAGPIGEAFRNKVYFAPLLVALPMAVGLVIQHRLFKHNKEYKMPENSLSAAA